MTNTGDTTHDPSQNQEQQPEDRVEMDRNQEQQPEDPAEEQQFPRPQTNPEDLAVSIAGYIATLAQHQRGDIAALRRMDPDEPRAPAWWRIMARYNLLDQDPDMEARWGLIITGIALMTRQNSGQQNRRTAHNGQTAVGKALYAGNENFRREALYREERLLRLLNQQGESLNTALHTLFRSLGNQGITFNWREMARFILAEEKQPQVAEQSRRRIAREYYRAQNYHSRVQEHSDAEQEQDDAEQEQGDAEQE